MLRSLIAFLALALAAPASAQLTAAEQKMQQSIDAEQDRTVAMLERWVNQNSGTMNFAGVEAVGRMLRAELEPIGFKVDWVSMRAAGRSGHIVARHKGSGRGKRHRWVTGPDLHLGTGAGPGRIAVAAIRDLQEHRRARGIQ